MTSKANSKQEQTIQNLKAQAIEDYQNRVKSVHTSTSKVELTEEDQAILKGISFKGRGRDNFYFLFSQGELIGKVNRVEGNTFSGYYTDTKGTRQEVAIAEVKAHNSSI